MTTPTAAPNTYEGDLARAEQFRAEDIADQATKEYLAAAKLEPRSPEPITDLADMLLVRFTTGIDNNPQLVTQASSPIDQALKLDPNYGAAYYDRGIVRGLEKQVAPAVADFRHYLQLDPSGDQVVQAKDFITQLTTPSTSTTTSPTTTP